MAFEFENPLSFIFNAKPSPASAVPSYEQLQTRRKIAAAMMAQRSKGYPKTLGEGLTAIGDAIGERGYMSKLDAMEQAKSAQDAEVLRGVDAPTAPPVAAARTSYADPGADASETITPAAPTTIAPAVAPAATPSAPTDAPAAAAAPASFGTFADDGSSLPPAAKAAVDRNVPPDQRPYYYRLVARESSGNSNSVSPTGAAGLTQFIPSTAKQYGLTDPADPDANLQAAQRFTADNRKVLTQALGRDPSPEELMLAHQQGAVTAGRMLSGTGNASPRNLAVNNVPEAIRGDPQAAARHIMNYYGGTRAPAPGAVPGAAPGPAPGATPPSGPPLALDGPPNTASDAPPIGMPAPAPGPAAPAGNARDAIAGALAARTTPPPVAPPVAPPGGMPPAMPQPQPPSGITKAPVMAPPQARVPDAAPVPPQPPTTTPRMQAIEKALTVVGDPLQRERLTQMHQQEVANQLAIYNQKMDVYKYERLRYDNAPERIQTLEKGRLDAEKVRQELGQQKTIKTETGEDLYFNEATRTWDPLQRGGAQPDPNAPPNVKLTETQQKALTYHNWAQQANDVLQGKDTLLAHGLGQELTGKVPFVGNKWQSDEYRRAQNAANNFVLAFMRSTSGAAYGEKERLDHAHAMLPRNGDDPKTLADKAAQRQAFVEAERAGLPQQLKDYLARQRQTETATGQRKQDAINIEMQGVTPKGVGDVKVNKKTGARRVWNGANWVEHADGS